MSTRNILIAITAFAVSAYLLRLWRSDRASPATVGAAQASAGRATPADDGYEETHRVAPRLAMPRRVLLPDPVERSSVALTVEDGDGTAATLQAAAVQPLEPEAVQKGLEPEAVQESLDEHFDQESTEWSWSHGAVRTIEQRIGPLMPARSYLRSVECHASLCRIETAHANLDDYRELVQSAFLQSENRPWNAGFFATITGEPGDRGDMVAVVYLAREGKELPRPD